MSLRSGIRSLLLVAALASSIAAVRQRLADPQDRSTQAPSPARLAPLSDEFLAVGEANRRDDFRTVRNRLAPLAEVDDPAGALARLVLGLSAHRHERFREAIDFLRSIERPFGAMEDWRLLVLAESAREVGEANLAQQALRRLIRQRPDSPLRALAFQRAIEIAAEQEIWPTAVDWLDQAQAESLPRERSREIDRLGWEIARSTQDPDLQLKAGRRLLIEHPALAAEVAVPQVLRAEVGLSDWHPLVDRESLLRRARNLLAESNPEEALETLSWVPAGERDFEWLLAQAEALTHDRRGVEALELLADIHTTDSGRLGLLEWQRAQAALDASRARRGRANLPQSRRQELRALALAQLEAISQMADDETLTLRALRALFAELSDEDDGFDRAFGVLGRLRHLDPSDTSGTRYLWRLGWRAFTQRDHPVAIGYWSELETLYPDTNSARSARYWTARAHESLGHVDRARDIFGEIASGEIEDFYSRHARGRLGETDRASDPPPSRPTEPWPEDGLLDRARRLSDLGLDQLALYELEGLRPLADRRAFCAVEALALAGQGHRRESIRSLACAFPVLGQPGQTAAPEEALRLYYPLDYREVIENRAREQGLSPYLVFAMVRQESAFDASARSWAGARGLMQVMPATGRELARQLGLPYSGSSLEDPDFSVHLGTRYFRQVLEMFDGNQELALAGYNGGPYRIRKLWRQAGGGREIDRFVESLSLEETKTYVKRILLFESSYQRLYAHTG